MPYGVETWALTIETPGGETIQWRNWWDAEAEYKRLHELPTRNEAETWLYDKLAHTLCQHQLGI